ncbi:uncharacterized protein QC763_710240 [Podospora pseudopauciseta]|uniref:VPS9 domain-containing protein n=1 Tax=Podospora pseudopauciseta TaxID=2093780 RepID=A0ABR0H207_9PEZI|nr:hypothetical protein QC763_710240 [Podospora pseudopauciseta]
MLSSLSPNPSNSSTDSSIMSSNPPSAAERSGSSRPLRSFRVERSPSPEPTSRPKRASTIMTGPTPGAKSMVRTASGTHVRLGSETERPDTFESRISEENADSEPPRASVDLDDLPIELVSLTDGFIDSLSAKVHSTPPNIDRLSQMFQDFYATASAHIRTHIDSLATLQRRDVSPTPALSTRASAASLLRAKAASLGTKEKTKPGVVRRESEMLTPEELAERKKARRALEQKKGLLEEAVERRLCEGVYSKIYRHRTTQDEAQDAKLRSKTAALAVVDIGPVDLGVELGTPENDPEAIAKKTAEVKEWLEGARKELTLMSQARYPLRKINHLKAAFKSIIDTLAHFHPSSSADELMPMLIYTLITLPPQNLNAISDINFIQRFRWEQKLTGEASYCLTTLEATISFLETVDLSTLRADETPGGPMKAPGSPPKENTFPPAFSPTSPSPPTAATAIAAAAASSPNPNTATASLSANLIRPPSPSPSSAAAVGFRSTVSQQLRNRRLSDLVNTPAQAFNAASDAVLSTVNTADQSLKTIGNSLGDSYKFLLGKLREPLSQPDGQVLVPKTLDDARKLIGTPPPPLDRADSPSPGPGPVSEDRPPLLSFISGTGRKVSRDPSADSTRSGGSRRALDEPNLRPPTSTTTTTTAVATGGGGSPVVTSPLDSMRQLGNSFNPLGRISAGIGGFRNFGRSTPTPSSPAPPTPTKDAVSTLSTRGLGVTTGAAGTEGGDLATAFPDLAGSLPPRKIEGPIQKFVNMQNAAEMKVGDVFELLKDYKRLAGAIKEMGGFKE